MAEFSVSLSLVNYVTFGGYCGTNPFYVFDYKDIMI